MVKKVVSKILYRIFLPLVLLTAVVFRFNIFSFIYLLLMLLNPLLPSPSAENMRSGHPKRYIVAILSISIIFSVSHIVFQAVMFLLPGGQEENYNYCDWKGKLFTFFGLHVMLNIKALDAIRLIGLDFLVMFSSFGVFITCRKLETNVETAADDQENELGDAQPRCVRRKKKRKSELWHWTGEVLVLCFLAGAGILRPSLISAVYFLIFLGVCTWFACNQKVGRTFLLSKVPLSVFASLHFILLYVYQLEYVQNLITPESLAARLLGLKSLIKLDCSNARTLVFQQLYWTMYVSPLFVLSLYWVLAVIIRHRIIAPVKEVITRLEPRHSRVDSKQSSHVSRAGSVRRRRPTRKATARGGGDDRTRLLDEDHMGRTYQATASADDNKETLAVDPNGSVIWTSESDMPDKAAEEVDTSASGNMTLKLRKVSSSVVTALKLIAKGSYVVTLIIMMTWSIMYHSWLTFILLLWSCILWMCPNSRQVCLRSSPALVMYAEALLLLQYILGLDLNESEIPKFTKNVEQIGLVRYDNLTYQPLAIKTLYTMMFWITLRQFVEERQELTRRDISEGVMMEPFNISYYTTQPGIPRPSIRRHFSIVPSMTSPNPYVRLIAEAVYSFLVKYWIWVVAIMLMVISLGGEGVVVYRIVYMFLFLFFILMFQFSYRIWRKIMYAFWLTVIIFSMLVLILIYTYQFEDFENYWADYLRIPKNVQKDLGLEIYDSDTGALFLRLLTPTFFLIITIIQLHYFHKEFLIISDIQYKSAEYMADQCTLLTSAGGPDDSAQTNITIEAENEAAANSTATASSHIDIKDVSPIKPEAGASEPHTPTTPQKEEMDSTRVEREIQAVKDCLGDAIQKISDAWCHIAEFGWRLLELHILKIVMFSVLCLAVYDVCAIHFVYMVFVVVALPAKSLQTFMSHCCSIWTAALLLSKMIYQLNVANYFEWTVNCTDVLHVNASGLPYPFNDTIDSRQWIGYERRSYLADYCKGYIGLILVLTIQAVVKIRQKVNRMQLNEPEPKPGVLFPDSTRATADKSLLECIKFLANYFFYKFGLEVCFVTTVACIGVRLDLYAVLSAVWLLCLFLLRRKTLAKIWPVYVTYQCVILPIQYIMCVGLPPGMCTEYPWAKWGLKEDFREWLFLPSYEDSPNAHKIIVDFFQLLFACCQLFVFRIETSPIAEMYEGGSNKEIYYENDNGAASRYNPIPDFVTYTKTCLDMLKALMFFLFFWITLVVVFQAGTSRVNLFAMGYVIGCFYFLWNGFEFYLKPRRVLLRMWNILIAYNVSVILIKTILQLIGCLYMTEMREKCCTVVQLFGIACLKKYTGDNMSNTDCKSDESDAGVIVDGVCFGFLLLQKRLFSSYYFQHLVNEIKAQQVLSSRGAELIHEIQMRDVQEQQVVEKEIMEKIKKKMDRIRAYQLKIRGGKNMEPKNHYQAIRSGDYYMFEEYSDEDIDLELASRHKRSVEEDEENAEVKEKGINALLSKAIRSNLKVVDEPRKDSGEGEESAEHSRQSTIVSADRFPIESTSTEKASAKSPDPQTIFSSGPTTTLSLPSPELTASTSKDEDTLTPEDVKLEEEEDQKEETFVEKIKRWWNFFCEFMNSLLISTTAKLNAISRDYRYVARKLSQEKKLLKEKYIKDGSFDMAEAEADMKNRDIDTLPGSSKDLKQSTLTITKKISLDFLDSAELKTTPDALDQEFQKTQPIYIKFLVACYYAAISRSELLCFLVIILNQIKTASILSLPLPLFVFLWGTLSVPRPTKAFWITIITYTEAVVVVKYLFQFYFFQWNNIVVPPNDPFYPPVLFGVMRGDNYAAYDLAVLVVVFFHRIMLKSLGLWKDTERNLAFPGNETESEKGYGDKSGDSCRQAKTPPPSIPEIKKDAAVDLPPHDELDDNVLSDDCACSEIYDEDLEDEEEGSETILEELQAELRVKECLDKVVRPVKQFFYRLLYPKYRVTVDVYAFMFFCDFINFFIVGFGYWAFGTGGAEAVTSYFKDNKVPIPFLIMLIAQFALIVTDRALYLRKYILGKLIFQVILVFVVHMWMFFILPGITLREFTAQRNLPPKLWYFTKCVYLLLSAYQIRSGYPTRILGNFFCKKYNYANLFLFKGYMFIPFLYELRSLMDWIWTDTSMNVGSWMKMEDIYSNIFVLKCYRRAEDDYPTPRGAPRTALIKYGVGGSSLLFVILIIWFPLLLFALGGTVGSSNKPISCTVELSISGFEPLFRMTALQYQIKTLDQKQWAYLQEGVTALSEPSATSFLANYDKDNTVIVELSGNSTSVWTISPPSRTALVNQLRGNGELKMILTWSFLREQSVPLISTEVSNKKELNLTDHVELRKKLADMIDDNPHTKDPSVFAEPDNDSGTILDNIFPNYVEVFGKGNPVVVNQFYPPGNTKGESYFGPSPYRSLRISMCLLSPNDTSSTKWWEVQNEKVGTACTDPLYNIPGIKNCDYLRMVAFNEKAFPPELSVISGYGIIGLYTTFVLVVSKLIRSFVAGSSFVIMFDDMPYVDRVLQLCLDIYLVRESREFSLEEDLFAKLIFLYRSPEMLIKWTRPPDQDSEDQQLALQE